MRRVFLRIQHQLFLDRNYAAQAEQALRLATDLTPAGPEAVFSYTKLLIEQKRFADARQLVQTAVQLAPGNQNLQNLLQLLKQR